MEPMEFRLVYRGPLRTNGSAKEKHAIRRALHPQLRDLWTRLPLSEMRWLIGDPSQEGLPSISLLRPAWGFMFAPLVSPTVNLVAHLAVDFLRPQEPGMVVSAGGDIDNRLKTLFDGLRMPKTEDEIPKGDVPGEDETPFFCLLEDDVLITALSVRTDRLLAANTPDEVLLLIRVEVRATRTSFVNLGMGA
jgi:hypothetical protein